MPRFFAATFLLLTIAVLHPATAQNSTTSPAREPAYGPELKATVNQAMQRSAPVEPARVTADVSDRVKAKTLR